MSLCAFPTISFSFSLPSLSPGDILALIGLEVPDLSFSIDLSCPLD